MPKVWNKRDPNVPKDAVYVGRPSVYGNPYIIGKDGSREVVIYKYKQFAYKQYSHDLSFIKAVNNLKGKDLVCWCAPEACHADVLLEIANK